MTGIEETVAYDTGDLVRDSSLLDLFKHLTGMSLDRVKVGLWVVWYGPHSTAFGLWLVACGLFGMSLDRVKVGLFKHLTLACGLWVFRVGSTFLAFGSYFSGLG
jgi:hypothetical protein